MQNVVSSVLYVEFVNQINSLVNELLYSPVSGYIQLKSKEAIDKFKDVIEKYNHESIKISKKYNFSDVENFINLKRKDLIEAIQKHYNSQMPIWIDEVFDVTIDNFMFDLSLNKNNKDKIWNDILSAIDWVFKIKKLTILERNKLIVEIKNEFEAVLKSDESDFMALANPDKSNYKEFIQIWDSIKNYNEFLKLDFNSLNNKLSIEDINFFKNLKNKLNSFQKNSVLDEIDLINTVFEIVKITTDEDKYDFIKQINDDFLNQFKLNKNLNEEEKIKLIKRRIKLFTDKNDKSKKYFKELINFSNE